MLVEIQGVDRLFHAGSFRVTENAEFVYTVGKATNGLEYPVKQYRKPHAPHVVTWEQYDATNKAIAAIGEHKAKLIGIHPISETEVELSNERLIVYNDEIDFFKHSAQKWADEYNKK